MRLAGESGLVPSCFRSPVKWLNGCGFTAGMATAKAETAKSRLTTSLSGCFSGVRLEYLFLSAPRINNRMDSPIGIKAEVILRKMTPKVCGSHLL